MRQKITAAGSVLRDGDVVSFSAGTTGLSPYSFRVLRRDGNIFESLAMRMPRNLVEALMSEAPPLVINCYPAAILSSSVGIFIDTYLSQRVFAKAMRLAAEEKLPVIIIAQPLFLLDALVNYAGLGFPFPQKMVLSTGGYYLPLSAEKAILNLASREGSEICFIQLYGVSEADAGILVSMNRNERGEPIYYPRDSRVIVSNKAGDLYLTLKDAKGEVYLDSFNSGDKIKEEVGQGLIIENASRMSEDIRNLLESWSPEDWARKTGFIAYDASGLAFQLRQHAKALHEAEYDFYEFQKVFETGSFLDKPKWSR